MPQSCEVAAVKTWTANNSIMLSQESRSDQDNLVPNHLGARVRDRAGASPLCELLHQLALFFSQVSWCKDPEFVEQVSGWFLPAAW